VGGLEDGIDDAELKKYFFVAIWHIYGKFVYFPCFGMLS
jgi:hypothetical protein